MSDAPEFKTGADRDTAMPRFYMDTRPNPFRSGIEGKPCFDDVEMVEINIPGDRMTVHHSHVKEDHRTRWPSQYAAFKAGLEAPVNGTPLSEWPPCSKAQAQELIHANVKTVEALAELPDGHLNKALSMGGFELRTKAIRWLEQASGGVPMEKLAAENDQLKTTMAEMERQMAEMRKVVDGLTAQAASAAQAAPQT